MKDSHREVLRQQCVYNPRTTESKPMPSFIFMFQQVLRAQTYAILESLHLEKRAGTETQTERRNLWTRGGADGSREQPWHTHSTVCEILAGGKRLQSTGSSARCSETTLGGEGGGREAREGGDICVHTADSCCCTQRLTRHCKAIILQLKIHSFIKT